MTRYLTIALIMALAGCGRESTTPSVAEAEFDLPADQVALGFETRMTNRGIMAGLLTADTAYVFEGARRQDLLGVTATFYDEQGIEAGRITSDTGEHHPDEGQFIARGNVVLITEGPEGERRLETEELYYEIREERLWSDLEFTLHEAGRTTRGTRFRTDSQFRTWDATDLQTTGPRDETLTF